MRLGRIAVLAVFTSATAALAYTPGSGTVMSDNFNGSSLNADWERPNGFAPNPSPWTLFLDGTDRVLYADGIGPGPNSPTRHWTRRWFQPVPAAGFSAAFEYRAELGTGYVFDLEVEQRAPVPRKVRLRVNASGAVSLWRTEAGVPVQLATTANNAIPANQKRWIRFQMDADPSGHPRLRARIWSTSATAETSTWNLDVLDALDTVDHVNRMELSADGPKNVETWIDDLDLFGDVAVGVASSIHTVYLMEASHLDIGFTEPPDTIEAFEKSSLDQVLSNLDADPDYRWFIEEAWDLDRWWERSTDTERANMVAKLQSGRIALGAGYASLHTTAAGHEELTRNVYWASRFAREHQVPLRTFVHDDVPGATFAIPEILARSGIEFYVGGMNTPFGGRITSPNHGDRPFWWVGPDGSRVLTWITFDSYAEGLDYGFSFFDDLAALRVKLGKKLPEQEEAGYDYPELLMMRAFDNHYQGLHQRDLVDQWNATYGNPHFVLATPEEFFDHMLATYGPGAFPSFSGDFGAAWSATHAGAQHTETMVRASHRTGRAAEALLAAGSVLDGAPPPAASIDLLYRNMLQVDEHSGAGGWPGYFTPEEMQRNNAIHLGYAQTAFDTGNALLAQGLDRALSDLPAQGDAIAVVNALGRARDGTARLSLPAPLFGSTFKLVERGGSEVAYQKLPATSEIVFRASGLPAFGYRVYDVVPGLPSAVPAGMLAVTATTIENDLYRIVVDPADGSLTSLYDKARGKEMIDPASTFDFNELGSNVKSQIDAGQPPVVVPPTSAAVTIDSSGPAFGSLKVTRTGTPHVETTYRLYRGDDRVEIENVLDRTLMPYVTNATAVRAYTVTLPFDIHDFEIRTETTTRFLDPLADGFPRDSVFDWHNVEHTLAFHDAQRGVLYAVDAVDAHSFERFSTLPPLAFAHGNALVLSRLDDKSDEYQFADNSVGPYEIEPGSSPIYRSTHVIRATGPSFDPAAASRFGFEALNAPSARLLAHRPGNLPDASASFFSVDAPGVLLYTVKNADAGAGIVFRLTELTGAPSTATISSETFSLSAPERIAQNENGPGTPLSISGGGIVVPLAPYETATVRAAAANAWAPIVLTVDKDVQAGTVKLHWTGGVAPFTVRRASDAPFTLDLATPLDEQPGTGFDDPTLADGRDAYYLVQ